MVLLTVSSIVSGRRALTCPEPDVPARDDGPWRKSPGRTGQLLSAEARGNLSRSGHRTRIKMMMISSRVVMLTGRTALRMAGSFDRIPRRFPRDEHRRQEAARRSPPAGGSAAETDHQCWSER